jgi:hypothetical protein
MLHPAELVARVVAAIAEGLGGIAGDFWCCCRDMTVLGTGVLVPLEDLTVFKASSGSMHMFSSAMNTGEPSDDEIHRRTGVWQLQELTDETVGVASRPAVHTSPTT